ncbi:MAG: aspartate aminotransferase family protein, partial [Opitutaceae bacterium]|nr:aspartate aminotransferase family protein [Opitutaceae bacterium]
MKSIPLPPTAHQPSPYVGPSLEQVLAQRKQFLNPGLFLYYKQPIMIVEGKMQYVWDSTGKRYLDGLGGIVTVSVGHCHPHVLKAINAQNATLQHSTTIYLNPNIGAFAEKLASKLPGDLKVCYFVNSGSEANDLALLMARLYTGNYDAIALRNGYHGGSPSSMGLTAHSNWKFNVPHSFGVHHAVAPYPYRGHFGYDDPDAGRKYADDVKDLIAYATPGKLAAFIAESIQGVGGFVEFPQGYLKHAYEHVRAAGGVCIADEVQTGFGRTGRLFAMDHYADQGITPDLMTIAKSLAAGLTLSAVTGRADIMDAPAPGGLGGTYAGNPLAVAAAQAVIDIMHDEQLPARGQQLGDQLQHRLSILQHRVPQLAEVRGLGAMVAAEFRKTDGSPDAPFTKDVQARALAKGLILLTCGMDGNVLRFLFPLTIEQPVFDEALEIMEEALL